MKQRIEIELIESTASTFILNYHKHPNQGGVGHVSMTATHNGESVKISIYPSDDLSLLTPVIITSMFVFPSIAVNHTGQHSTDSPVHTSYDITDLIINKDAALEEMKKLHQLMESGQATFSLTPNSITQTTSAILNKNSYAFNILRVQSFS